MSLRLSLYAFFLLCFSNSVSLSLSCFFSLLLYYLCRYQFSFFFLPTSLFLYDRFSLILLFLFIYFFLAFLLYKLFLVSPFRSFNVSLPYSKTDFSFSFQLIVCEAAKINIRTKLSFVFHRGGSFITGASGSGFY